MSSSRDGYHHGSLARALEDAAMQLLATRSAHEISLREVARAANVSHNAPYHHFTDRLGLLRAIAERSMRDLIARVETAIESAGTPSLALRAGTNAYISFAIEHPHAFDAVYDPTVCIPGAPTETMAPLIDALETALFTVASGVGLDTEADANAVWGLVHGLGMLAAAGHLTPEQARASCESALDRMLAEG
ncbi:TetR/AcrR family transcriptional regulator [Leucobacter sp. VD1]|uniref:TetR/AcrR family transcriptional regulator n=1 Tax=Leucobacter sp. VD1 TaxID=3080381 RepID=UPI00301AD5C6